VSYSLSLRPESSTNIDRIGTPAPLTKTTMRLLLLLLRTAVPPRQILPTLKSSPLLARFEIWLCSSLGPNRLKPSGHHHGVLQTHGTISRRMHELTIIGSTLKGYGDIGFPVLSRMNSGTRTVDSRSSSSSAEHELDCPARALRSLLLGDGPIMASISNMNNNHQSSAKGRERRVRASQGKSENPT
jgi:hypothetical protein